MDIRNSFEANTLRPPTGWAKRIGATLRSRHGYFEHGGYAAGNSILRSVEGSGGRAVR
ncbi:hypothetical protein L830_1247 [Mycobacteroides abscessus MAB_082312_2258]|nr:hypothetical protein L830_1247 [Mycobacteroides abscessus MAB_082312_2258]